ncbi:dienelactone hydrolase [Acidovorax sp. A1169]|uniref:alpha/beta hydrolase family protein n=1 Tax=Acidovorax sp. A1169 TaxID=3059524 RepID=UPI002737AE78|nr:dienelactone hydrolase [Acidovorax sp. A1169]MDP4076679.1 dienelactone hydrolase [Acidovorax sp. A1169]
MKHQRIFRVFAGLLALSAGVAQAGVGLHEIPGMEGDGPVTVYYPSSATDQPLQRGPFTLQAAWKGAPVAGNGRLVVISHGSGGNPWVHSDLARGLVGAGFVVAMPEHAGDNAKDPSTPGPESWKKRPAEVSRAIDAVARDAALTPLLALDRVGMYGMSAGGHTALSLAGGRWSPALFKQHCEAHIADDFATCVGLFTELKGNFLDGVKKTVALGVIRQRFDDAAWQVHTDPRIAAVVSGVPAAADFDMESLAKPRIPLALITSGKDLWLVPRFHSDRVIQACAERCTVLAALPDAGHGALLSPQPPVDRMSALAARLLGDPPGFDRSLMGAVDVEIVRYFERHLLAPASVRARGQTP